MKNKKHFALYMASFGGYIAAENKDESQLLIYMSEHTGLTRGYSVTYCSMFLN